MRQAWHVLKERTSIEHDFEDYFALIGRPFSDIMHEMGIEGDLDYFEKIYMRASFESIENAVFFDHVQETLKQLAEMGVKLGVVTSKDPPRTKAVLSQLPVSFSSIQSPTGMYRGKPAPDYLMIAMAESATDPSDTLYVGDMPTDMEAAKRAGIDYVHASWGYGRDLPGVAHIDSIKQLPKFII